MDPVEDDKQVRRMSLISLPETWENSATAAFTSPTYTSTPTASENKLKFPRPVMDSTSSVASSLELKVPTEGHLLNRATQQKQDKSISSAPAAASNVSSINSRPSNRPLGAGAIPIGVPHKITFRNSLSTVSSPPNSPPASSIYLPQSIINKPKQNSRPPSTVSNPTSPTPGQTTDAKPFFQDNPRVRRTILPYGGAKSDGLMSVASAAAAGNNGGGGDTHAFVTGNIIAAAERRQFGGGGRQVVQLGTTPNRANTQDLLLTLDSSTTSNLSLQQPKVTFSLLSFSRTTAAIDTKNSRGKQAFDSF